MADTYHFGPRMSFDKLHQNHSTLLPSEYVDKDSRQSNSCSSNTSKLGKHWKKVDTSTNSINSAIIETPTTLPSYSSTVAPCRLQMQGLEELTTTIQRSIQQFSDTNKQHNMEYEAVVKEVETEWKKYNTFMEYEEVSKNIAIDHLEGLEKKVNETTSQIRKRFQKKDEIEQLLDRTECNYGETIKTLRMIWDQQNRIELVRHTLIMNEQKNASLTTFTQEDHRVEEVLNNLVKMIDDLTLNHKERSDFDCTIQKIRNHMQLDGKMKCEMIASHLMSTMSSWERKSTGILSGFNSAEWKSVGSACSKSGNNTIVIESSSFALSDSSYADSNLNDLEGDLLSASIRRAVEGPKQIYEFSPWNSGSVYSGWSSFSNSQDSFQSVREPATLSSYVVTPSIGESTLSSLSAASMPDQMFYGVNEEAKKEHLSTAISASGPVSSQPPRTINTNSVLESANGTRTRSQSTGSLNFSNVSLSDMVDEAIHTAKDVAETQVTNLMEALQNSARKCGVAVSDLMTATSSSSESLSDTQATHRSNNTITH